MTSRGSRPRNGRLRPRPGQVIRRVAVTALVLLAAVTAASFGYNRHGAVTLSVLPARPDHDQGGRFRYPLPELGECRIPIVLIPGAFETADTFAALGAALGASHRVFAIDLTGTGYSQPSPPFSAGHLAAQVLAFVRAEHLTGRGRPVLAGHSSGAAVAGMAALDGGGASAGVIFLDGDALALPGASFAGRLLIDPYRTSLLRLALSSSWLIRTIYTRQCGPACLLLTATGVEAVLAILSSPDSPPPSATRCSTASPP